MILIPNLFPFFLEPSVAFVIGQAFAANVLTYANWIRIFLKKKTNQKKVPIRLGYIKAGYLVHMSEATTEY